MLVPRECELRFTRTRTRDPVALRAHVLGTLPPGSLLFHCDGSAVSALAYLRLRILGERQEAKRQAASRSRSSADRLLHRGPNRSCYPRYCTFSEQTCGYVRAKHDKCCTAMAATGKRTMREALLAAAAYQCHCFTPQVAEAEGTFPLGTWHG